MKYFAFTLKREAVFLAVFSYTVPVIGLLASLILWISGYFE